MHESTPQARRKSSSSSTKPKGSFKNRIGSYALFSFAIGGWCLFFVTILIRHASVPSSAILVGDYAATTSRLSVRNLRTDFPKSWKVPTIHKNNTMIAGAVSSASNPHNQQQAHVSPRSEYNARYKQTNNTMAACLLVNDDTIKLTEWLAYHYTVLPLSHLIVAIDPNSLLETKIRSVLDLWKDKLQHLEVWSHDTWMMLNATQGWRQSIYKHENTTTEFQRWFLVPQSVKGRWHRHNRRQEHFSIQCMRKMKQLNASWVLHTDTDEFLTYNYLANDEDPNSFDAYRKREDQAKQAEQENRVRELRKRVLPIRQKLPDIGNVSIADFLSHFRIPGACFHVPGLQISAKESNLTAVTLDVPPQVDARKLMTLRHRKYGRKSSHFTKAMIDVSKVDWNLLVDDQVVTIHTPIRDVCPNNGFTGSGYDYMASIFRLHHYAGTFRSFLERQNDGRRTRLHTFHLRDVDPIGENDDVRPWIKAFVLKVGIPKAIELLSPLERAYEARDLDSVS